MRCRHQSTRRVLALCASVMTCAASIQVGQARAASPGSEVVASEQEPEPEPTTAGEWYARGYDLARAGQYEAAAEAFLRSYELKPTSEALFNAALALENGGDTLASIETYERVLVEPSIDPALVDQATRSIEELTRTVATLKDVRYFASRPPAELYIRGEGVELDAFPVRVLPGKIEVVAVDEAGARVEETYQLYAGETLILDLRGLLPPIEPAAPPEPVFIRDQLEPAPVVDVDALARRAKSLRRATWAGVGLTGTGALATITVGALSLVERGRYDEDTCLEYPGGMCPDDFPVGDPELHARRGTSLIQATWIVGGATAGLALATVIVAGLSARDQRRAKNATGTARVRLAPALGGLVLRF